MWTADSTQITADQTCWTADGSNNCCDGGGTSESPIGPGFFIFFQNPSRKSGGLPTRRPAIYGLDESERIIKDDEEILWLIQLAVTRLL